MSSVFAKVDASALKRRIVAAGKAPATTDDVRELKMRILELEDEVRNLLTRKVRSIR